MCDSKIIPFFSHLKTVASTDFFKGRSEKKKFSREFWTFLCFCLPRGHSSTFFQDRKVENALQCILAPQGTLFCTILPPKKTLNHAFCLPKGQFSIHFSHGSPKGCLALDIAAERKLNFVFCGHFCTFFKTAVGDGRLYYYCVWQILHHLLKNKYAYSISALFKGFMLWFKIFSFHKHFSITTKC